METFLAPNGAYIVVPTGRVTTFGLSEAQNKLVEDALPAKGYALLDTEIPTDLIAVSASARIINAAALDADAREMLFDYFTEVGSCEEGTVFWISDQAPPRHLRTRFKCCENFEDLAHNLKYHLLSAHRKTKKFADFSKRLADCLMILSLIRSHPGIRTQELAEKVELPARTVQRYISTLQAAGEWIEYARDKKGWQLQNGISILFGDHLPPEE